MSGPDARDVDTQFVAPGTPIDLDNCAREPIHIPGSIQPRGLLLVVREPELTVLQVSANVTELLGVEVGDALEAPLGAVIGAEPARVIERAIAAFSDLRDRNPHDVQLMVDGEPRPFDAILHREPDGVLLVELEIAYGPRPFSFPNTYQAVRRAVGDLNRATGLRELYQLTADAVRDLTGFDRVMVYRYDQDYNGEVVAEAKRDDLNSFLGLHYPATDIPAQARALYEKNWIRLIHDVNYTPAPLVPTLNPLTGESTDLTYATLRSVSPIHCEYLQNMGVGASMSISLLRDGVLWGLIACHHYSGTHLPPFGTRAAAEFLGSTLSLRLVDRFDDDAMRARLNAQNVLAKLTAATLDESESVVDALLGAPDLLDLVPADGVEVVAQGNSGRRGALPDPLVVAGVVDWARDTGDSVVASDNLARELPDLPIDPGTASGALVLSLPEDQHIVWFRAEEVRAVDWGGDPHNKAIAVQEGSEVRLSPRRSFERWRETVRERSAPWADHDVELVGQLRQHVVEAMYQRTRSALRMAEVLQRSLLPELPDLDADDTARGWGLSAHYEPAAGGRIGGDWYDAFRLADGRLVTVLGDVAGHGMAAAGTMAQLRNALRAYLHDGLPPAQAIDRLNGFVVALLPRVYATVAVALVDLASGGVEAVTAGHPTPFVVAGGAASTPDISVSPPVGVAGATSASSSFTLPPGSTLVLFSDGLIERRGEDIDVSRDRLAAVLRDRPAATAQQVWEAMRPERASDDATVVSLRRPG